MKNLLLLLLLCTASAIIPRSNLLAQTPAEDPHWIINTSLSDEFSYTGTDQNDIRSQMLSKWKFIHFTNPLKSKSIGYVASDGRNVRVDNGVCTISTQIAPGYYWWPMLGSTEDGAHDEFYFYTRGQMVTNALMHYGYYELKFRFPHYEGHPEKNDGIGANFWFYPETRKIPLGEAVRELDVFEHVQQSQYIMGATMHYGINEGVIQNYAYPNIGWDGLTHTGGAPFNYKVSFADLQFHTLGFEWQPEYIAIYWDGQIIRSMNYAQNLFGSMNVILDINVSPGYEGSIGVTTNTHFPFNYEIEYFRYYDLSTTSPSDLSVCVDNYANVNSTSSNLGYTFRDHITLGGSSCSSAKVKSGSNLVLRAKSSITLDEGFELDENSSMYLQVNDR